MSEHSTEGYISITGANYAYGGGFLDDALSWTTAEEGTAGSSATVVDTGVTTVGQLDREEDYLTIDGGATQYFFTGFFVEPFGAGNGQYFIYSDQALDTVSGAVTGNVIIPYNGASPLASIGTTTDTRSSPLEDDAILCFVAGTKILTAEGESIAVETLSVGQQLTTSSGESRKIKFIFKDRVRHLGIYFDKSAIMPVRILQGALGADSPSCDLLLSPSHALLIDGNLVEAHGLINGSSIYQETSWEGELTYYHIEMEDHDIIYAENTATETFIDNASRVTFDNYDEYKELYGEEQDMLELEYPRAKSSRQLPRALKQKLLDRATILYPELITKKVA